MLRITPEMIEPTQAAEVLYTYGEGGYPPGSFAAALIDAIKAADPGNMGRLSTVFPGYVNAVRMVRDAGRLDDLRAIAAGERVGA